MSFIPGYVPFKSGKVRDLYDVPTFPSKEMTLSVTTDRISAFDQVIGEIEGKGIVLNSISNFWKDYFQPFIGSDLYMADGRKALREFNIFEDPSDLFKRSILIHKFKPLPFEFIVRGYMAGGLFKQYKNNKSKKEYYLYDHLLPKGLKEAEELPRPIFTPSTKADQGHDINVSFWDVADEIGEERAEHIRAVSIALYLMGHRYLLKRGVILADTKFEFAFAEGHNNVESLYLIDEVLTFDSSRLWDLAQYCPGRDQESFDKQPFRDWLEKNWDGKSEIPEIPKSIEKDTIARLKEIQRRIIK